MATRLKFAENRIHQLPCWNGSITIEPLHGGLSNESFLVTDSSGRHFVRIGADYPFHHVSREREIMTARAAYAAGFAPKVEYSAAGMMVTEFLDAKTLGENDVIANSDRIARLLRNFHLAMPRHISGAGYMFWVFHVVRDYARTLSADGSLTIGAAARYVAIAEELEAAQMALPIIFGHNDLLPSNLLDDGERLWLIDFEYAGFSTAMFDLAGVTSNAGFSAAQSIAFMDRYFEQTCGRELRRSLAAMQCASLLREVMWSLVSRRYMDTPGADYEGYMADNITRLAENLDLYHSTYGKAA